MEDKMVEEGSKVIKMAGMRDQRKVGRMEPRMARWMAMGWKAFCRS
jgi:hypothetical protein